MQLDRVMRMNTTLRTQGIGCSMIDPTTLHLGALQ